MSDSSELPLHCFTQGDLRVAFQTRSMDIFTLDEAHDRVCRALQSGAAIAAADAPLAAEILSAIGPQQAPAAGSMLDGGQARELFGKRVALYRKELRRLTLMLTDECNLRCRYCYEGRDGEAERKPRRLDDERARRAIDLLLPLYERIESVMFFGGEPLLRMEQLERLAGYVRAAAQRAARPVPKLSIITNGTLVSEETAGRLKELGLFVTVSLDGPADLHDRWRVRAGGEGTYADVEGGIDALHKAGVPVHVQSTVTPDHVARADAILSLSRFFRDRFGITNAHIVPAQFSRGSGLGWDAHTSERLLESFENAFTTNLRRIEEGRLAEVDGFSLFTTNLASIIHHRNQPMRCPSGMELALAPDGWLYPCFMFAFNAPDLRLAHVDAFEEPGFWERLDGYIRSNAKMLNGACSACWAASFCSGCMGSNLNVTGSLDENEGLHCNLVRRCGQLVIGILAEVRTDPSRWKLFRDNFRALLGASPVSDDAC